MVIGVNSFSQVLDVPSRWDIPGCGIWCVPVAAHGIIIYYGNSVHLCEVLEVYRAFNSWYGSTNCCDDFLSCCAYGFTTHIPTILLNWQIPSTYLSRALTKNEVSENLSMRRPFIIGISGHVMTGYGMMYDHVHINDGGGGQVIIDYNSLITDGPYNDGRGWINSVRLDTSAQTCPEFQFIPGALRGQTMVYKAFKNISAECYIGSWGSRRSAITFRAGGSVFLNPGFEVELGSALTIFTGSNPSCP